ncbi:hypothetical protein CP981_33885 [Streptomyces platensis]|uniref:Uncharacterized protein n=1 Tax=Streptomyces platensis TaxID=58346 RepID=A0AAE6NQA6_STRPT|nr:hypothetical protein CP981_33885 [Streptomyces platensis]
MGEAQRAGPEGVADQDVELSLSRGARASNGTDPQVVREGGAVRGGVGWGFCGGRGGRGAGRGVADHPHRPHPAVWWT